MEELGCILKAVGTGRGFQAQRSLEGGLEEVRMDVEVGGSDEEGLLRKLQVEVGGRARTGPGMGGGREDGGWHPGPGSGQGIPRNQNPWAWKSRAAGQLCLRRQLTLPMCLVCLLTQFFSTNCRGIWDPQNVSKQSGALNVNTRVEPPTGLARHPPEDAASAGAAPRLVS